MKICPEYTCPRRLENCPHAKVHEENKQCSEGCHLHTYKDGNEKSMHKCVNVAKKKG